MTGIPSSEFIWVTTVSKTGVKYYTTSKWSRDKYYLYREEDGKAVKVAASKNPLDFDDKIV